MYEVCLCVKARCAGVVTDFDLSVRQFAQAFDCGSFAVPHVGRSDDSQSSSACDESLDSWEYEV